MLALVWIAGPLSGVIVQPYVGIKSDRCRSRIGKRRPFIIGGAITTIIALMVLAWTRELVVGFLGIFGVDPQSKGVRVTVMLFATVFVYMLDFAINVCKSFDHHIFELSINKGHSTSGLARLRRGLCSYPPTRECKCMDIANVRCWQHLWYDMWRHQSSQVISLLGEFAIQGSMCHSSPIYGHNRCY